MLCTLQIEQKEIETLEIELKEKVASLAKVKKEFDETQVLYLVVSRTAGSLQQFFLLQIFIKFVTQPHSLYSVQITRMQKGITNQESVISLKKDSHVILVWSLELIV